MVTKKSSTKKNNFVVVSGGTGIHYRLERNAMVSVTRDGRKVSYGRFIPKGEVIGVLTGLWGNNKEPGVKVRSYGNLSGGRTEFTAYRHGNELEVGCNKFSATDVKKLARWAGLHFLVR